MVNLELCKNKHTFVRIFDTFNNSDNVTALCESILAIIHDEEEKIEERNKID